MRRANAYELHDAREQVVENSATDGEGWLSTHEDRKDQTPAHELQDMDDSQPAQAKSQVMSQVPHLHAPAL